MVRYGPVDSLAVPRFAGIITYMRLPHVQTTEEVDFAVVGVPFDTGASFRVGQRFAPAAVREMSVLLRPYNPAQRVNIFEHCSGVDYGDIAVTPGYTHESYKAIESGLAPLFHAGVVPLVLGGDHSITLPELRAASREYGPLALVHFDSHGDLWDETLGQRYMHGTPFRRALEEGIVEPSHSIQVGIRGPVYGPGDIDMAADLGLQVMTTPDVAEMGAEAVVKIVRDRVGDRPAFLTFDIDVVDPAYAPGTGTPEVGGLTSRECLQIVRGLTALSFVGFDVVEVLPAFDHGQVTALLAANIAYEFLSLIAIAKRDSTRIGGTLEH